MNETKKDALIQRLEALDTYIRSTRPITWRMLGERKDRLIDIICDLEDLAVADE